MHQVAISFALLAGALLLVTALFGEVQEGIEELDTPFADRFRPEDVQNLPPPRDLDADLLAHGTLEGLTLDEDLLLSVPAGTYVDGDELVLAEPLRLALPAGSSLLDFRGVLPEGTIVRLAPGSAATSQGLTLGPGTTLVLPGGTRLGLYDGGTLTGGGIDARAALSSTRFITGIGTLLEAPSVELLDGWSVNLAEGTRIRLPADWQPPADWTVENGRLTEETALLLPAGTPLQGGAPPSTASDSARWEATGGPLPLPEQEPVAPEQIEEDTPTAATSPPLLTLAGVLAFATLATGFWWWRRKRPMSAHHIDRRPIARLRTRLDARVEDLPLALAPGTTANLHVAVLVTPQPGLTPRPRAARLRLRLDGRRVYTGPIPTSGLAFPLTGLATGDHNLEAKIRTKRFGRATTERHTVRVATWPEQVARDWQDFADALATRTALPAGATPRQVRRALAGLAPHIEKRLGHALTAGFEEASYSPREVRQAEWERYAVLTRGILRALDSTPERIQPQSPERAGSHPTASRGHETPG